NATPVDVGQQDLLFRQYKLAVEMATGISARRQAANKFYISLLSGFGAFYSLLEKASFPFTGSAWRYVLPILPVCWCVVWRRTIQSHRRINIAKWKAIEELEAKLPGKPFTSEGKNLGEGG